MQPQELDAFFQGLFLYRDAQAQHGHQVFQFRPLDPQQLATLMAGQDQTSTPTPTLTIESKEPPQPTTHVSQHPDQAPASMILPLSIRDA
jgi:hypothetical protein